MSFKFKLPALGEGIMEGEIVSWPIKEGDMINEDDTLVEVQNDKSVEEIPSPVTGRVVRIVAPVGTVAVIGDVLVEMMHQAKMARPQQRQHQKQRQHLQQLQMHQPHQA